MARTYDLHVLFSQEELDMIHRKMANMGIKNRSAFLRKMALDGYIVNLDMDDIHEMIRLLRNTTNNLNQIAKKANSDGTIYGAEISAIVFNSTSIDGKKKFRDFRRSGIALQKVSDLICIEHGLSVIEPVSYSERKKRTQFPAKANIRETICMKIDEILSSRPKDFSAFLEELRSAGYEIKVGANIAVKGIGQKRFIRLSSLPDGYRQDDIMAILSGERTAENRNYKKPPIESRSRSFDLILDLQEKAKGKGAGYEQWGKVYNLQQLAKTILFLDERNLRSISRLSSATAEKAAARDELLASIKASETRLAEIATLRKHIINYSKTRGTYEEYRKAGYSKKFFEAHREELTLHKAAKAAFDELGVKKIPKVKDLNAEYAELLASKKHAYAEYRKVRDEAQELAIAERNIATLYENERQEEQRIRKNSQEH